MIRFYIHAPKETTEHIIQAYKHGNLSQICDISKLKRRLQTSYLVPVVTTEKILIDINFMAESYEQVVEYVGYSTNMSPVEWQKLADNRDFRTIQSYEPNESTFSEELVSANFQLELVYARIRRVILLALVTCINSSEKGCEDTACDTLKTLTELISSLKSLSEDARNQLKSEVFMDFPQAPYRSQMYLFLPSKEVEVVHESLLLIQAIIQSYTQEKNSPSGADFQPLLKLLDELNADLDKPVLSDPEDWTTISDNMETVQYRIEIFSLLVLFTSSLLNILRSGKRTKKVKKIVLSAKLSHLEPEYRQLTDRLITFGAAVKKSLDSLYELTMGDLIVNEIEFLKLQENEVDSGYPVPDYLQGQTRVLVLKILESWKLQQGQMDTALASKNQILHSIIL